MITMRQIEPSELHNWIPTLHKGIKTLTEHSDRDDFPYPAVLFSLYKPNVSIYAGFEDGQYRGFIILTVVTPEFSDKYLLISGMYSLLESREEWDHVYETVVKPVAEQNKCCWIEFRSKRRGWDKVAPHWGFEKVYSIYRREV